MGSRKARYDIYSEADRWNPITWSDTYEEAVSFCKTYSMFNGGGIYGIRMSDMGARKDWYDQNGFICCTI